MTSNLEFIKEELIKTVLYPEYIDDYLNLCISHQNGQTKHHILPRALYPEYISESKNPWNIANISNINHLIAHWYLYRMYRNKACTHAFKMMYAFNKDIDKITIDNIKEIEYDYNQARISINDNFRKRMVGMVTAKNILTNEIVQVSKEEFESNDNYVGVATGIGLGDNNVSKRDDVKEKISKKKKNQIIVSLKESPNDLFCIDKGIFNDEIYIKYSPTFGHRDDMIFVKSKNGEHSQVFKTDPRYLSGELIHINKSSFSTYRLVNNEKVFQFLTLMDVNDFCKENNLSYKLLLSKINTTFIMPEPKKYTRINDRYQKKKNNDGWGLFETDDLIII